MGKCQEVPEGVHPLPGEDHGVAGRPLAKLTTPQCSVVESRAQAHRDVTRHRPGQVSRDIRCSDLAFADPRRPALLGCSAHGKPHFKRTCDVDGREVRSWRPKEKGRSTCSPAAWTALAVRAQRSIRHTVRGATTCSVDRTRLPLVRLFATSAVPDGMPLDCAA